MHPAAGSGPGFGFRAAGSGDPVSMHAVHGPSYAKQRLKKARFPSIARRKIAVEIF
jgi:hypothetical protein